MIYNTRQRGRKQVEQYPSKIQNIFFPDSVKITTEMECILVIISLDPKPYGLDPKHTDGLKSHVA